jgi:putative addiction module component (TIGR02574 family)
MQNHRPFLNTKAHSRKHGIWEALAWENLRGYLRRMALDNLAVVEEALSLSPNDRVELAKLLIQSLEGDHRTDDEIRADLNRRLEDLISGKDPGLTFEQVFGTPL